MTQENNNMGRFFDWLSKPLSDEDIYAWFMANNINSDLTELFRDFCFSLLSLMKETYLGGEYDTNNETKIGMTNEQKKGHFKWCWDTTVKNFQKENISFEFENIDYEYFESFVFEVFYEPYDLTLKDSLEFFFSELFDRKKPKSKSDIEMFTDIYKLLERSLKL